MIELMMNKRDRPIYICWRGCGLCWANVRFLVITLQKFIGDGNVARVVISDIAFIIVTDQQTLFKLIVAVLSQRQRLSLFVHLLFCIGIAVDFVHH